MTEVPFGALTSLGKFKPCVYEDAVMGVTMYIHEDVPYYAKPMMKGHGVDALLAMDDNRLVGVQFWRTISTTLPPPKE